MTGTGLPELAAITRRWFRYCCYADFGTTEEACRAGIRKTREYVKANHLV